jgi:hypothetical protein
MSNKHNIFPIVFLTLLLAACSLAAPGANATIPNPTAVVVTVNTVQVITVVASTAVPGGVATLPAGGTPLPLPTSPFPTPIPTLPGGESPTELKYLLLRQYPNLFYCDPDIYPVARADETDLARQIFPQLQAATEEFQAILVHTGLQGQTTFNDGQKLVIYREHKKLAAIRFQLSQNQYRFQLQTADNNQQGFLITGWINGDGQITVDQRQPTIATCPICLAAHTLIDTPRGAVLVEDLRPGDPVWTADAAGMRFSVVVLRTVRVPVPASHRMVHLILDDGRELWASPGHPLTDGRTLGDLRPGDRVEGATVSRADLVSYDQPATYDLLPAGETGFYWADGILVGSTLAGK